MATRILPVATRIYRLVGAFMLLAILTGAISLRTLSRLKVNGPVYNGIVLQKDLLADIQPPPLYLIESYMTVLEMLGEANPATLRDHISKLKTLHDDFTERSKVWSIKLAGTHTGELLTEQSRRYALPMFAAIESEFIPAILRQDKAAASSLAYEKIENQYLSHRKAIDELVALASKNSEQEELSARRESNEQTFLLIAALTAGLLLIGIYSSLMVRSLMQILKATANLLGSGCLEVSSAATQVSASSQSLAAASNQQAASVEETSASLEEVASMVRVTANNAEKAKLLAAETRSAVNHSSQSMTELNKAMEEIDAASTQVARIVKNIDEIAFQTNILALNAAVEAARAGESGAGFAVVADEVRSLAQRSAAAARETAEKIEVALESSQKGLQCTIKVGDALLRITEKVGSTDIIVGEIATAAREQAQSLEQINEAISQVDRVSQGNANNAEQGANAAANLSGHAASLQALVARLRLLVGGKPEAKTASTWGMN